MYYVLTQEELFSLEAGDDYEARRMLAEAKKKARADGSALIVFDPSEQGFVHLVPGMCVVVDPESEALLVGTRENCALFLSADPTVSAVEPLAPTDDDLN